jgi:hypothetical protein
MLKFVATRVQSKRVSNSIHTRTCTSHAALAVEPGVVYKEENMTIYFNNSQAVLLHKLNNNTNTCHLMKKRFL